MAGRARIVVGVAAVVAVAAVTGGVASIVTAGSSSGTALTQTLPDVATIRSEAEPRPVRPAPHRAERHAARAMVLAASLRTAPPPPTEMPPVGGGIGSGASGDAVRAYEQRLADLRFDPGPVDGVFDLDTRYAVEALQKISDLPRTGVIGEAERAIIGTFRYPEPLTDSTAPNRTEVSLDRQYMIVYQDGFVRLITTISSGSGRPFCGGDHGCQMAVTPPGEYTFHRRISGWHKAKLGTIYNPVYFNGGIAVHGYPSVPTYNASHGCVRIPMHIADYFQSLVPSDSPVFVVGTEADPVRRFSGPGPGPQ